MAGQPRYVRPETRTPVLILRWTEEAVDDLARLHDFVAIHNPQAALRIVTILRNSVRQLPAHPRLGTRLPGFDAREVRRLVVGDYEVRYELARSAIHVLRFFHAREDR